jgi:hypothetical protein
VLHSEILNLKERKRKRKKGECDQNGVLSSDSGRRMMEDGFERSGTVRVWHRVELLPALGPEVAWVSSNTIQAGIWEGE